MARWPALYSRPNVFSSIPHPLLCREGGAEADPYRLYSQASRFPSFKLGSANGNSFLPIFPTLPFEQHLWQQLFLCLQQLGITASSLDLASSLGVLMASRCR